MASSFSKFQESRTHFPFEIQFGDFDPIPLTNLKDQPQSGPSPLSPLSPLSPRSPLSPQLRYSLSRKQPRIRKSPPPSSSVISKPSLPPSVTLISSGSYNKISSHWCPDDKEWISNLYLSRSPLLKTMIHRRIPYRTSDSNLGIEIMPSPPMDYWVTFPLYLPAGLEIEDLPKLKDVDLTEFEEISTAYAAGRVKPSGHPSHQIVCYGDCTEADYESLPFKWVRNTTSRIFHDRKIFESRGMGNIAGYVECPKCKESWCIGYFVPERFDIIDDRVSRIATMVDKFGEKVLQKSHFDCRCKGKSIPVIPIISEDVNKINWMFLFLGMGIGYCTEDQLKAYCTHEKLPISDKKEKLLVTVFVHLYLQITKKFVLV